MGNANPKVTKFSFYQNHPLVSTRCNTEGNDVDQPLRGVRFHEILVIIDFSSSQTRAIFIPNRKIHEGQYCVTHSQKTQQRKLKIIHAYWTKSSGKL